MNKTKIEWVKNLDGTQGYTWNPITGCLNNCPYCYARRIGKRFSGGFEPKFHPDRLGEPSRLKKPSTIFVCSMGEMFGDWIHDSWISQILHVIENYQQHTFQILTKCPEKLYLWDFPPNVWLGVTVESGASISKINELQKANARIKFISFEPLLEHIIFLEKFTRKINWAIIGAETGNRKNKIMPKIEWIRSIVNVCSDYHIPIFLKNNLQQVWGERLVQEFPERDSQ